MSSNHILFIHSNYKQPVGEVDKKLGYPLTKRICVCSTVPEMV